MDGEAPQAEWLTIAELATLVRKSRSAVHKLWPGWATSYGLRPVRFGGRKKGRLLFEKREVLAMLEQWRIEV
jgi:hypothetical protein